MAGTLTTREGSRIGHTAPSCFRSIRLCRGLFPQALEPENYDFCWTGAKAGDRAEGLPRPVSAWQTRDVLDLFGRVGEAREHRLVRHVIPGECPVFALPAEHFMRRDF